MFELYRQAARCFAILVVVPATLAGCVSVMPLERQEKLHGLVLYGIVNTSPTQETTVARLSSTPARESCLRYQDEWCTQPDKYTFVSLLLMNTYAGGLRSVGTVAPKELNISKGDIVVVRLRKLGTGEFVRLASRGERADCRWTGGGLTRALTAAGVTCEDYDWRTFQTLFYD